MADPSEEVSNNNSSALQKKKSKRPKHLFLLKNNISFLIKENKLLKFH